MANKYSKLRKKLLMKKAPQLMEAAVRQIRIAEIAVGIAEDKTAKLACVLSYILANGSGEVQIAGSELAMLPQNAMLHEEYDDEADIFTYRVAVPKRPKIEVVSPEQARVEIVGL